MCPSFYVHNRIIGRCGYNGIMVISLVCATKQAFWAIEKHNKPLRRLTEVADMPSFRVLSLIMFARVDLMITLNKNAVGLTLNKRQA